MTTRGASKNETTYQIRRVLIRDFGPLEFADVSPARQVTIITGENGAGKSHLLKAIRVCIGGGKLPPDLIRHGAEKSEIEIELTGSDGSAVAVKKTIKRKDDGSESATTELAIDGEKIPSPQSRLTEIIGAGLSLDPSEFDQASGKERVSMMLEAIGRADDVAAMDARFAEIERARREKGSGKRNLQGELEGLDAPKPGDPSEPVDTATLTAELTRLTDLQKTREADVRGVQKMRDSITESESRVSQIDREIEELQAERQSELQKLSAYHSELKRGAERIEGFEPLPIEDVRQKLTTATTINSRVEAVARYRRVKRELADLQSAWDSDTAALRQIEADKSRLLAEAGFPDAGIGEIGICADDVTVKGCRWSNVADSHRVIMAMQVAMAMSGRFRDVAIKQAAWFTETTQGIARELAHDHGFRLWLEIPGNAPGATVVIDNGVVLDGGRKAKS